MAGQPSFARRDHAVAFAFLLISLSFPIPSSGQEPLTPIMGVEPSDLDFGAVPIGEGQESSITVRNLIADPRSIVEVSSIEAAGDGFAITHMPPFPIRIAGGGPGVPVAVRFSPRSVGPAVGTVRAIARALNSPATIHLRGEGMVVDIPTMLTGAWDFDAASLSFTPKDGFEVAEIAGLTTVLHDRTRAGLPSLPVLTAQLLLPRDRKIRDLRYHAIAEPPGPAQHHLYPVQIEGTLDGGPQPPFAPPDPEAYASPVPYRQFLVEVVHETWYRGYRIATVNVYPLQFVGATTSVILNTRIAATFTLERMTDEELAQMAPKLRPDSRPSFRERVRRRITRRVANPDALARFYGEIPSPQGKQAYGGFTPSEMPSLDSPPVEYVIVTSDDLEGSFQRLADWKTRSGLPAVIRTIDWIEARYPGLDVQERIRNFIRHAYAKWGTNYVLLGGDTETVPDRFFWVPSAQAAAQDPPVDYYYAALDGNWNSDGDSRFGEQPIGELPGDDPDFDHEVMVARAPVNTPSEAETFVNKVLTYTRAPGTFQVDGEYYSKLLLLGGATNSFAAPDDPANGIWVAESIENAVAAEASEHTASPLTAMRLYENVLFDSTSCLGDHGYTCQPPPVVNFTSCSPAGGVTFGVCSGATAGINRLELTVGDGYQFAAARGGPSQWVLCTDTYPSTHLIYRRFGAPGMPADTCEYQGTQLWFRLATAEGGDIDCSSIDPPGIHVQMFAATFPPSCTPGTGTLVHDFYQTSLEGCDPASFASLRTFLCEQDDADDIYAQSRNNRFNEDGVLTELSAGYGYVFHQEHSYVDRLGGPSNAGGDGPCCVAQHHPALPRATTRGVVSRIDSGHKSGIFFSIGSYQNSIDKDAVSEALMRVPSGGAVAYFGQQRSVGADARYFAARDFFVHCYDSVNFSDLGEAAYEAMESPNGQQGGRATTVELLLLGDPAMAVVSDVPQPLAISGGGLAPITSLGQRTLEFNVTRGAAPVAGATVCVTQDSADAVGQLLYKFTEADASGLVRLDVSLEHAGTLLVTVTARNATPDTASVPVTRDATAADVFFSEYDLLGNLDDGLGWARAGYADSLRVTLENRGQGTATNVTSILTAQGTVTFDLVLDVDPAEDPEPGRMPERVFIGPGLANPPTVPFTFRQLVTAGIDPEGGPTIPSSAWGYFLWRRTDDRKWYLKWRGDPNGDGGEVFTGTIKSSGGFLGIEETPALEAETDSVRCESGQCQDGDRIVTFAATANSAADEDGVKLRAADTRNLAITGGPAEFGTIAGAGFASANFGLAIDPEAQDAHEALLELEVIQQGNSIRTSRFTVPLTAPMLTTVRQLPDRNPGSDTTRMDIRIQNRGTAIAEDVTVRIENEQGATILDGTRSLGYLRPGKEAEAVNLRVRSDTTNANVRLKVTVENRYAAGGGATIQWVRQGVDIVGPYRPTGVQVVPGPGGALITWLPPDRVPPVQPDSAVAGYNIYRREDGSGDRPRVNDSLVVGGTSFFDDFSFDSFGLGIGPLPEWPYWYSVVSVDSSWNESAKYETEVKATLWLAELPGWPKQIDVGTEGSVLVEDIDGDGDLEILHAGRSVFAWHHDGTEVVDGDQNAATGGIFFSDSTFAVLGDTVSLESGRRFTNDLAAWPGHLVVGSSWGGKAYFWSPTGQLVDTAPGTCNPCNLQGGSGFASPVIADMNLDGKPEIVISTHTGWVNRWTYDPVAQTIGPVTAQRLYTGSFNYGGPAIGNVDGDAPLEIVYPTRDPDHSVIAVNYDWTQAWEYALGVSPRVPSTPTIANLDADAVQEVVVSFAHKDIPTGGIVAAIDGGAPLNGHWPVAVQHQIGNGDRVPSPAATDLRGDAAPEVIVGDGVGGSTVNVSVVDTTGTIVSWHLQYLRNYERDVQGVGSPISVVNVDADPKAEVIHGTDLHHVVVWDSVGAPAPGWPIVVRESVRGRVTIADLDNLGKLEVVASDLAGLIHIWDYRDQMGIGLPESPAPAAPMSDYLGVNRPNPFNPSTVIPYELSRRGIVTLRIFTPAGRLLRVLEHGERDPGHFEAIWDGRDTTGHILPSGVYLSELRVNGQPVGSRKLLLLH